MCCSAAVSRWLGLRVGSSGTLSRCRRSAGRWTGRGQFWDWTRWTGSTDRRRGLWVGERLQLLGQLLRVVCRQRASSERRWWSEKPGVINGCHSVLRTSTVAVEDRRHRR